MVEEMRGQSLDSDPGAVAPNTPVLVGVAAVQQRIEEAGLGLEPVELMIAALKQAAEDAGSDELLRRADRMEVPKGLWNYSDPARLVAAAIGAGQAHTVLAEIGILQQTLINRACNSIASGACNIVLVTGAEAKYRALRGQIAGVEIAETAQQDIEPDTILQPAAELWSTVESDTGLGMPVGFGAGLVVLGLGTLTELTPNGPAVRAFARGRWLLAEDLHTGVIGTLAAVVAILLLAWLSGKLTRS